MLQTYGLYSDYQMVKAWYDGYSFGNENIYCPWDVINYCADHCHDRQIKVQNYWLNTSGNTIVRRFVDKADLQTRNEIEQLIAGKTIRKEIRQELTYKEDGMKTILSYGIACYKKECVVRCKNEKNHKFS